MNFEVTRPELLVLLAGIPVLWVILRHSLVDMKPRQRASSLVVRCLILLFLVLALAGLSVGRPSNRQQVIALVDASASIREVSMGVALEGIEKMRSSKRKEDRLDVIYFAEQTTPLIPVEEDGAWTNGLPETWPDRGTDLALAMQQALAQLDPSYGGRILVFTDGIVTGKDPASQFVGVSQAGKRADVVPVSSGDQPEVQVVGVNAPAKVHVGEPFPLHVTVQSREETEASVAVFVNGVRSHEEKVTLNIGENHLRFRQVPGDERVLRFSVQIHAEADQFVDNNTGYALVRTGGKPKVLLIEARPQDGKHLRWALQKEDIEMEIRSVRGIPRSVADLQNFDLMLFSDVPATDLTVEQMEMVRAYVRDLGGGFVMLGGENSFGLGGYYKTVIEEILPVRTDFERERETPSLGMVLVIDKSGSMGGQKIELAKEAAKAAAELLDARDQLGVLAFDGQSRWVSEIHNAADRDYIIERISSLQAGGGTDMGPALSAAFSALEMTVAKLKHVIVLTDGHSTPANFYDLVTAMRSSGITISSVGVGSGADQELLERIASWGEGRYYFTSDPLSIPQIFAKETMTASKSAIKESPFIALPLVAHQVLQGINFEDSPFLLGFVITKPKPTSELILVSETGEPLLALWRYGLGKVGAFTSDAKNRWAAEWLEWPGFSRFWAQLVRETMRTTAPGRMHVEVQPEGDHATAYVELPKDSIQAGGSSPDEAVVMRIIGPDLEPEEHALEQIAPGRYGASFPTRDFGDYHVQVSRSVGGQALNQAETGYSKGYPEELRLKPPDHAAMRGWSAAATGLYDRNPADVFLTDRLEGYRVTRIWPLLLQLALLLIPIDIALRRIEFPRLG